jgi:N-acetylglutamate synthase-like GNAT family acetyltransferase
MLIRQAKPEDIPVLRQLIPESVRLLSANSYTTQQIESALLNLFGVDTRIIEDGTYYVAEMAGRIVGCGGWSKRDTLFGGDQMKADEDDVLLNPQTDPARIRAFFVHPEYARRGIGSRIMEACERAALAAHFTTLELVATLPGEPLYKSFGYDVVERFDIELPEEVRLPVARMRKQIVEPSDNRKGEFPI